MFMTLVRYYIASSIKLYYEFEKASVLLLISIFPSRSVIERITRWPNWRQFFRIIYQNRVSYDLKISI